MRHDVRSASALSRIVTPPLLALLCCGVAGACDSGGAGGGGHVEDAPAVRFEVVPTATSDDVEPAPPHNEAELHRRRDAKPLPATDAPATDEPAADAPATDEPEPPVLWPIPSWTEAAPEDHGLDPAGLQEAADYAEAHGSHCMVVVRHGAVVGEWYWGDTTVDTLVKSWSVGKSYASTVVGLALDRGDLGSLDDFVADYVPEWLGTDKDVITVRDLLGMTSGLELKLVADNVGMVLAPDMSAKALAAPLVNPPGLLWEYSNHTVQVIEPVLRAATGVAAHVYAEQHLFAPLGMTAEWATDAKGQPAMYMNVKASCRDHARFGYLFLRRGRWGDQQVLSEAWVDQATSPSTSMNQGYGAWWWLNGGEPTLDSVTFADKGGILHPFAPEDAFCAVGLGSQMVEVVPSEDLVVVRMGPAPQDDPAFKGAPLDLVGALLLDGKQEVHNGVLERVLDARL